MYKNVFGALTAGALVFVPVSPAHATGSEAAAGKASAVVLRAGLDIKVANNGVRVPLALSLNEVHAPESAEQTTLSARIKGVDRGKPFNVLRADVATSRAEAEGKKAEGYSNLVNARVRLPGLGLTPLVKIKQATSTATCEVGKKPVASSNVLGPVVVLGQKVSLKAGGSTTVSVPGIGEVRLKLSETATTASTAAATALRLNVELDPANLEVAEVKGDLTLVQASCETGTGGGSSGGSTTGTTGGSTSGGSTTGTGGTTGGGSTTGTNGGSDAGGSSGSAGSSGGDSGSSTGGSDGGNTSGSQGSDSGSGSGSGSGGNEPGPQTGTDPGGNLAETGSGSATPYVAAGAAAMVVAGGAALLLTRRRKAAARNAG